MVKVKEDMTGWVMAEHGIPDSRLIVIEQIEDYIRPNGRHSAQWLCECSCESHTRFKVLGENIKKGKTKSCGCLKSESTKIRMQKSNIYEIFDTYGICYMSNTNHPVYFDIEDYNKIKNYCWYEDLSTGYAKTKTHDNKWIFMHRLLTDYKYKLVDHENRNKLDNRKNNLRDISQRNNMLNRDGVISTNSSGYTGVYLNIQRNQWAAQICINNKTHYLGLFSNKKDAIIARLRAEKEHFGEFAPQRYLFEEYGII